MLNAFAKIKQRWMGVQGRLLFVLVALVLLIFIRPLVGEQSFLLVLFLVGVLVGALYAIAEVAQWVWVAATALGVPHIAAIWLGTALPGNEGNMVGLVFGLLFYSFVVGVLLRFLLTASEVTVDMLYGAVSIYFLLGLIWTMAYAIAETMHPGSLTIARPGSPVLDDFMYYSFVTLTTLGYGDITPATPAMRSLAILQAITGVFYTTVLVARLVGLYLVQLTSRPSEN
ncbi:MAG: ion channel [Bacteroidota bacterium]